MTWRSQVQAKSAEIGIIQSSVMVQDANTAIAAATSSTTATPDATSTISGSSADSGKSDYEKLMDQRRLQRLNKLWSLYWNRAHDSLSAANAKRVSALMAQVSYPVLSAETTSSADVTAAMRKSISSLGHELEVEQASATRASDPDTASQAAKNIEYLHGVVEHNLTETTYWLRDTPEVEAYINKMNSMKLASSSSR